MWNYSCLVAYSLSSSNWHDIVWVESSSSCAGPSLWDLEGHVRLDVAKHHPFNVWNFLFLIHLKFKHLLIQLDVQSAQQLLVVVGLLPDALLQLLVLLLQALYLLGYFVDLLVFLSHCHTHVVQHFEQFWDQDLIQLLKLIALLALLFSQLVHLRQDFLNSMPLISVNTPLRPHHIVFSLVSSIAVMDSSNERLIVVHHFAFNALDSILFAFLFKMVSQILP